jgi:1-acyl-sn-glycerol-3-phosphate acyltransferase
MRSVTASIKFILFIVSTFGLYSIYLVAKPFKHDLISWRRAIFGAWATAFVRISDFQIEKVGDIPEAPFFLVSNHLGYIDIPIIRSQIETLYVSKSEVEDWPMAGRIVRDMGTIFIDRKNNRDIPRAGEEILNALSRGEGVVIFPEGGSGTGRDLLGINSSFFEFPATNGIPVIVMTVSYRTGEKDPEPSQSISWWDDTPFALHLFNLFKLRNPGVVLRFGSAVVDDNRKALARKVEAEMRSIFTPMK